MAALGVVGMRPKVVDTPLTRRLGTEWATAMRALDTRSCPGLAVGELSEPDPVLFHAYDAVMAVAAGAAALRNRSRGARGWQKRGSGALRDSVLRARSEGTSGELHFDEQGHAVFHTFAITNFQRTSTSTNPSGFAFVEVGTHTDGELALTPNAIQWLGGSTQTPVDRTAEHDLGPARQTHPPGPFLAPLSEHS